MSYCSGDTLSSFRKPLCLEKCKSGETFTIGLRGLVNSQPRCSPRSPTTGGTRGCSSSRRAPRALGLSVSVEDAQTTQAILYKDAHMSKISCVPMQCEDDFYQKLSGQHLPASVKPKMCMDRVLSKLEKLKFCQAPVSLLKKQPLPVVNEDELLSISSSVEKNLDGDLGCFEDTDCIFEKAKGTLENWRGSIDKAISKLDDIHQENLEMKSELAGMLELLEDIKRKSFCKESQNLREPKSHIKCLSRSNDIEIEVEEFEINKNKVVESDVESVVIASESSFICIDNKEDLHLNSEYESYNYFQTSYAAGCVDDDCMLETENSEISESYKSPPQQQHTYRHDISPSGPESVEDTNFQEARQGFNFFETISLNDDKEADLNIVLERILMDTSDDEGSYEYGFESSTEGGFEEVDNISLSSNIRVLENNPALLKSYGCYKIEDNVNSYSKPASHHIENATLHNDLCVDDIIDENRCCGIIMEIGFEEEELTIGDDSKKRENNYKAEEKKVINYFGVDSTESAKFIPNTPAKHDIVNHFSSSSPDPLYCSQLSPKICSVSRPRFGTWDSANEREKKNENAVLVESGTEEAREKKVYVYNCTEIKKEHMPKLVIVEEVERIRNSIDDNDELCIYSLKNEESIENEQPGNIHRNSFIDVVGNEIEKDCGDVKNLVRTDFEQEDTLRKNALIIEEKNKRSLLLQKNEICKEILKEEICVDTEDLSALLEECKERRKDTKLKNSCIKRQRKIRRKLKMENALIWNMSDLESDDESWLANAFIGARKSITDLSAICKAIFG